MKQILLFVAREEVREHRFQHDAQRVLGLKASLDAVAKQVQSSNEAPPEDILWEDILLEDILQEVILQEDILLENILQEDIF